MTLLRVSTAQLKVAEGDFPPTKEVVSGVDSERLTPSTGTDVPQTSTKPFTGLTAGRNSDR